MFCSVKTNRASFVTAVALFGLFAAAPGPRLAFAGQPKHETKHDARREVEALEEQWRVAQLASDTVTMDKLLADDFIGISMSGQVNTKAQQLERVRTRKLVITRIELSDRKVKLLGNVAIVTSVADVEGTSEGISMKGRYRYTRVYQRKPPGIWRITSFEATKVVPSHEERSGPASGPISPANRS